MLAPLALAAALAQVPAPLVIAVRDEAAGVALERAEPFTLAAR